MNYWLLKLKGIEIDEIRVKPENVEMVKSSWESGRIIHTPTRSIPASQIKDFVETDIPYIDETKQIEAGKLMEDAAKAFNEPMMNSDGSVIVKWVKKSVPSRMWQKYYAAISGYRLLSDDGSYTIVAFRQPVHQINDELQECTEDDINKVARS